MVDAKVSNILVLVALFMVFFLPGTGSAWADVNFGHTESVKETIEKVDEKVRERMESKENTDGSSGGSGSGCSVSYPDWLQGVRSVDDLREELLVPDTAPSSPLAVKGNPDFDESADLTADTILRRCNTYFRDKNDNDIQHWAYCRAFQLPSGDTFTDLSALQSSDQSDPPGLYTVALFHGSNVDDPSENWLVPLINKYKNSCLSRPLNVIWMGVRVTDQSRTPPEPLETLGNKWHVTSTSWKDTVLYDLLQPSELNFTAHTTASCPQDNSDTRGLYVGGEAEAVGRRLTGKFSNRQALWVGKGSANKSACYSGTANDNPVNANNRGVQFEYQVLVPETSDRWVDPDNLAESIIEEF